MRIVYRGIDQVWRMPHTGIVLPAALGLAARGYIDRVRRTMQRRAS